MSEQPTLSGKRKVLFAVTTAVLVIVLPLVLAEVAVRLFGSRYTMEDLRRQAILYEPSIFGQHMLPTFN